MMLAVISHSMPPSFARQSREQLPSPTMTTLAIYPQRQQPSLRTSDSTTRRPKLHLNTQQIRTFGKGSSLRLDTLSAVSPTARNTFSNAYEPPASAAPALGRPSKPRLCIDSTVYHSKQQEPILDQSTPNSASTPCSGSTVASAESATISIPYKQPHNIVSILSNSPARQLIPRKMAPARPLFPATKKVSFRTPLVEEIKTVKYTLAHSDIESSTSSLAESTSSSGSVSSTSSGSSLSIPSSSSDGASSPSLLSPAEASSSQAFSSLESSPRPRGPRTGEKRDSSSSESDSDDNFAETPVAGRRKRSRDWRWTLGPIGESSASSSTSEMATSGDESS